MTVLDTNVISEVFRPAPEPRVVDWLASLTGDVAITAITLAELLAGVRRLPDGRGRKEVTMRLDAAIESYRGSRAMLPFDDLAADRYADVLVAREAAGAPISTADAQIAAICLAHGATCATRDMKDFAYTGVALVDPWQADACCLIRSRPSPTMISLRPNRTSFDGSSTASMGPVHE